MICVENLYFVLHPFYLFAWFWIFFFLMASRYQKKESAFFFFFFSVMITAIKPVALRGFEISGFGDTQSRGGQGPGQFI